MAKQPKPITRAQRIKLQEIARAISLKKEYEVKFDPDLENLERHGLIRVAQKMQIGKSFFVKLVLVE